MNHCDDYNIKCPHMANICEWTYQRSCPGERYEVACKLVKQGKRVNEGFTLAMVSDRDFNKAMEGA
jgi:hypothetical protein